MIRQLYVRSDKKTRQIRFAEVIIHYLIAHCYYFLSL